MLLLAGCASSPDGGSTTSTPDVASLNGPGRSPCKVADPAILLCADFDDGSASPLTSTSFGGGTIESTTDTAVSLPSSIHVKTIAGQEAAAALLLNHSVITEPRIVLDADLKLVPGQSGASGGAQASLLRVNMSDDTQMAGAFFVHFDKSQNELFIASVSDDDPTAITSHALGPVPSGWFHVTVLIEPAPGGGAFAQAQVDSGYPATVLLQGDPKATYGYSLEAGLNVPAADDYEGYIDNVVVRNAVTN
jgi:hypothetical protein